jgi:hypothetical protein
LGNNTYFQDFNYPALPKAGNSKHLPQGWSFETFSNNDDQGNQQGHHGDDQGGGGHKIHADDGHNSSGGVYSYGARQSDDRALGILRGENGSGGIFGAEFENAAGGPINQLNISFTGEEWRLGRAGRQNQLQFQYSLDAHSLTSGDWFNVPTLSFSTPNTSGVGAHDGNLEINQQHLSGTISFLDIASGGTFWVRWVEAPSHGPGDGLAIDNFSISAVPEISTCLGGLVASALLAFAVFPGKLRLFRTKPTTLRA